MSLSVRFTPEEEALLEAASRQSTRSKGELVRFQAAWLGRKDLETVQTKLGAGWTGGWKVDEAAAPSRERTGSHHRSAAHEQDAPARSQGLKGLIRRLAGVE